MRDFYLPHRKAGNPLYNDDIIYSPDVYVIKTDISFPDRMKENDWYKVNVITCAAPNLRDRPSNAMNPNAGNKAAKISNHELHVLLETRIRRIFKVAVAEGNEVLILVFRSAVQCGKVALKQRKTCAILPCSVHLASGIYIDIKLTHPTHLSKDDLSNFKIFVSANVRIS